MKRCSLFLLAMLSSLFCYAQETAFTVALTDAVWNFDDYENTKPTVNGGSEDHVVPANWISGNGGTSTRPVAAYQAYIFPCKIDEQVGNFGYDGRYCLQMYHNASPARTAPFVVLPKVMHADTVVSYNDLLLNFYGKGSASITSTVYEYHLKIGYINALDDTLRTAFNNCVQEIKDTVFSVTEYNYYSISLAGIPDSAWLVLYDDDATRHNMILLDNISLTMIEKPNTGDEGNGEDNGDEGDEGNGEDNGEDNRENNGEDEEQPTDIQQIAQPVMPCKIMIQNELYIVRDEKIYTLTGVKVK